MIIFNLLLLSFSVQAAQASIDQQKQPLPVVLTKTLNKTDVYDTYLYPARILSKVNTVVVSESSGIIKKIFAPMGQKINRNEKLFVIKHTDPVYQFAPVFVLAPTSGIISQLDISEGTTITQGQKLALITDPKQLKVSIEIPAQDLTNIAKDLKGELSTSTLPSKTLVKITGISPFVDPATGTASAELEFINLPLSGFSPGMLGQVSFKTNLHQAFLIPEHALVYRNTDTFIRLFENGKAKEMRIDIGKKQNGLVEITSALLENVVLIERSSRFIKDGEEVTK